MHKEHTDDGSPWKEESKQLDAAYRRGDESRRFWANQIQEANVLRSIINEGLKYMCRGERLLASNNPKVYGLARYFLNKAKSSYEKYLKVGGLHGDFEPLKECNEAIKSLESRCKNN